MRILGIVTSDGDIESKIPNDSQGHDTLWWHCRHHKTWRWDEKNGFWSSLDEITEIEWDDIKYHCLKYHNKEFVMEKS
tara:strand:- start:1359 stop:1592 length:234 start_codon:yes stop_codon:yes gene_type:complete